MTDMDSAPKTVFSFRTGKCADPAMVTAPPGVPRFMTHYRRRDLPIPLPGWLCTVSIRSILLASCLSWGVVAPTSATVNAPDAPLEQSAYDPLAASVDLFISDSDAPRLWVRGKDDYERAQALLTRLDAAATHGLSPSRYDVETLRGMIEYYETYYETYGRSVELIVVEGSGTITDAAAARADAVRIDEELDPFMVWGGPTLTNAFAELCRSWDHVPLRDALRARLAELLRELFGLSLSEGTIGGVCRGAHERLAPFEQAARAVVHVQGLERVVIDRDPRFDRREESLLRPPLHRSGQHDGVVALDPAPLEARLQDPMIEAAGLARVHALAERSIAHVVLVLAVLAVHQLR